MKTAAAVLVLTLFAATTVDAGTITYDLRVPGDPNGRSNESRPNPSAPAGEPTFYDTALAPGSSLTLEFDANGDGTRGDVTIAASQLRINASFPGLVGAESISLDIVGELTGGLGTIIDYGENYPLNEWISWSAPASYSVTGTWQCFGAWCGEHGYATGVPLPYEELLALNEATVVPLISLGSWQLWDYGSTAYFQSFCHYDYPPACHTFDALATETSADPSAWSAGVWLLGHAVPEPSGAMLLGFGVIALALRRARQRVAKYVVCAPVLLGVMSVPGASHAATIAFDLAGTSLDYTYSSFAPSGAFITPFSGGSSITVEFDANRDGISGDLTIAASQFLIRRTTAIPFADITITTNFVGELSGGLGAVVNTPFGDYISWSTPGSYTETGTWQCLGSDCLDILLVESGFDLPHWLYVEMAGLDPVEAIALGSWTISGSGPFLLDAACSSPDIFDCHGASPLVTYTSTSNPLDPAIAFQLHGRSLPEPSAAWLVAGGLVALALRRSGRIRRHEDC